MFWDFLVDTFGDLVMLCGAVAGTVFILALIILLICEKHNWF